MRVLKFAVVALMVLALPSVAVAVTTSTNITVSDSGAPLASATVSITRVESRAAPKPKTAPPRATTKSSPTGNVAIRFDDEDLKAGTRVDVTVRTATGRVYRLSGMKLEDVVRDGIDIKTAQPLLPPRTARPAPRTGPPAEPMLVYPGPGGMMVVFGGSWNRIPQVSAGTRFSGGAAVAGTEIPIVDTRRTIPGVSAGLGLVIPTSPAPQTSQNILWGDYFYVDGGFNGLNDSVSGTVPIGTASAFTYIFPNPASGSTGIAAGATGQTVTIATEGRVWDVAFGTMSRTPTGQLFPTPSGSFWSHGLGFRYRNLNIEHRITQQSLTFADLNVIIDLDVSSHFIGPNFAFGFEVVQPLPSGPFAGFSAFVAPGALITGASARQASRCAPCGAGSPEFNLVLQRDFSDTAFAVMTGVNAFIGYRVNPFLRLQAEGSYQYMSRVMSFAVPVAPTAQPIRLVNDSLDSFSIGARAVIDFNPVPDRRASTL